jgi:LmbE family N-acetylglucosaminyl deacetylase
MKGTSMRRLSFAAVLALACAPALGAQQLTPPGTGGVAALDRALAHLGSNRRVLVIGAHPDDEDTELLTLLSRWMGVDAAYLSLSRGEGGQNLIGPELGEGLGLIRTGELLAARSVDGSHQYFTRGFDFGFSKSLAETARFWPRDSILADAVRVVRRFRPQVIVAIFTGTPRDGHGQHQMSGLIARDVFEMLKDSAWGPRKLYRGARFDTSSATLRLASGQLDPVSGKSILQLAMAGRSLHRSQDMGQFQRLGASVIRLALAARAGGSAASEAPDRGLFDGVDTALAPGLAHYAALIDSARATLGPGTMGRVAPLLLRALAELRQHAPADVRAAREPLLEEAIGTATGIVVDAAADNGRAVAGDTLNVMLSVWNAGGDPVRVTSAEIATPTGWLVAPVGPPAAADDPFRSAFLTTSGVQTWRFSARPPADAPLSEPYFLTRPLVGDLYDWSVAPDSLRGEPFDPPLLMARVSLEVAGTPVTLRREVSWRFNDQASGEERKPVFVVPAVGVSVSPDVLVWPVGSAEARTVTVELVHGARGHTEGEVRLELPGGWPEVAPQRFALEGRDTRRSFTFEVRAPRTLRPGSYEIHAVALAGGQRFERASVIVDYPHIRPVAHTTPATLRVEAAQLALPPLRFVGYVRGAADQVPEALTAIGVPVTVLGPSELARGDLSRYDAIVVGSRAYETDSALVENNGRLLDYARAGGRLIVQYQQYPWVRGNFAPYPARIAAPHDRVTDETAPVRLLQPSDPVFQTPNAIGPGDWEGWVQERGLYFLHDWDPAYRPLLETGDNGERLQGGLVVARLGRGLYVYTGLSFFRQLPAGVAGAYRLFANLLGLQPSAVP